MTQVKTTSPSYEPAGTHRHLICWKSIFAGLFISIVTFMILSALGTGILGSSAEKVIDADKGGMALLTGAGLWLGISTVIALFIGSYFATRISGFVTNKVGSSNGAVIASIFFILAMVEAGSAVGALSRGLGKVADGVGQGTSALAASPQVQDAVHNALGTTQLKSDSKDVVQGLAVRLMQGDVESAKSYFAYQTGLAPAEVDAKVAQLQSTFEVAAKKAGEKSAAALADTGWTLLMTFSVGLLAAIVGGVTGAESNAKHPLAVLENETGHFSLPLHA